MKEVILARDLGAGDRLLGRDGRPHWTVEFTRVDRIGWPVGNGRLVVTTTERPDMPLFFRERSRIHVKRAGRNGT